MSYAIIVLCDLYRWQLHIIKKHIYNIKRFNLFYRRKKNVRISPLNNPLFNPVYNKQGTDDFYLSTICLLFKHTNVFCYNCWPALDGKTSENKLYFKHWAQQSLLVYIYTFIYIVTVKSIIRRCVAVYVLLYN